MASPARRLRRIIKEEINQLKRSNPEFKKRLLEFYGRDLTDENPVGFAPGNWTSGGGNFRTREAALINLGAKPFALGINPHGYQLDVKVTDPSGASRVTKQDRLWFYNTGTVYTTNQRRDLFYKTTTNKDSILLYTTSDGRDSGDTSVYAGDILMINGIPTFRLGTQEERKELTTYEKFSDWSHTVLDWAGFIPGWGDVIDIVNAAWYFIEGDYFEGALSLIAVIPIVGSALKSSFKLAVEAAERSFKGFKTLLRSSLKNPKDVEILWKELQKTGILSKNQLEDIGSGLGGLYDIFKKNKKSLPDDIANQLDEFAGWLKQSSDEIAELTAAGVKGAERLAKSGATLNKTITTATDISVRGANKIISAVTPLRAEGLFKRIRGLAWFPEKKLLAIAKGLESRFAREMASPNKLMALAKTTPNPTSLMHNLSSIKGVEDIMKKHFPTWRQGSSGGALRIPGPDEILGSKNAREFQSFFKELESDPRVWERASKTVTDHAISNNSLTWSLYRTDAVKSLKTTLSKRDMAGFVDMGGRKWIDIVYNELDDMGEDISQDEIRDNPTAVIYPIIKAGVETVLPGTATSIKKYRDSAVQNPLTKTALKLAGYSVDKDGGVIKSGELNYDPYGEAGGSRR